MDNSEALALVVAVCVIAAVQLLDFLIGLRIGRP